MIRYAATSVLILGLLPGVAAGGEDSCRAQAEQLSGYRPPLIAGEVGRLKFRLSGSVGLGISSGGEAADPPAPPFAGAASAERREAARQRDKAELYQRLFDACMKESGER